MIGVIEAAAKLTFEDNDEESKSIGDESEVTSPTSPVSPIFRVKQSQKQRKNERRVKKDMAKKKPTTHEAFSFPDIPIPTSAQEAALIMENIMDGQKSAFRVRFYQTNSVSSTVS